MTSLPPRENQKNPPVENSSAKPKYSLVIKDKGLTARLTGKASLECNLAEIRKAVTTIIRDAGVKHGLDVSRLQKALEILAKGEKIEDVIIARGTLPQPGRDAEIKVLAELSAQRIGSIKEDGHVDFKDKGPVPVVEPGTELARLIPADRGKPGMDVRGRKIKPPKVRLLRFDKGQGVRLKEDGLLCVADRTGIFNRPDEETFEVLEIMIVDGDIDYHTGHVEFPGMVQVHGTVLSDFHVHSKGLLANELEPGSEVIAEGDVAVQGGVMGATLETKGKLTARFARDSRIKAKGDVVIENEVVDCKIETEGRLILTHHEGRIVNSSVKATLGVEVPEIVSSGSEISSIVIGPRPEYLEHLTRVKIRLEKLGKERTNLIEAIQAQTEELETTEDELRDILANLKKTSQPDEKTNLITQVHMIKPLRENLLEGVKAGKDRLYEMEYEEQRMTEEIKKLEEVIPEGAVCLDVIKKASASTEIRGPRSAITLNNSRSSFTACELAAKANESDAKKYYMKISDLRTKASRKSP